MLDLLCRYESELNTETTTSLMLKRFETLISDNLIEPIGSHIDVTETGRNFLRNICLVFDERYYLARPEQNVFSTTA